MILYIILGIILIINIITIILAVRSFKTSKNEYYSDDTIDFATIVFDNQRELNLLKLQAYSFKFVDKNLINKIFIFYQDSGKRDMKDVIAYYPEYLQDKVIVLYFDDMNFNKSITLMTNKELWRLQQYIKLYLAKLIEKEYYCMLDAKNHFIKNVGKKDFFTDDGKYYIFTSDGCNTDGHHNFSKNSFKYFGMKPEYNISKKIFISMSTPFIFDKKQVIQMFNNIEKNEKTSFENWFLSNKNITEFYIFGAFIEYNKSQNHKFKEIIHTSLHNDPNSDWSLKFVNDKLYLDDNWKIFGLHRKAPPQMSSEYKENLINMYKQFYDDKIIAFITENILK